MLIGVGVGDVVVVLDWDSYCYLECYYVILMMGVVLMMVNVWLLFD